jgi:hypothetical protein
MIKLKVLQLTDAKGYEQNYYSAQLEALIGDKHITETYYFLTDDNVVVNIDKDVDSRDLNVKKAIEAGAVIKNIFYVDDNNFSEHSGGFNPKGVWDFVEHAEEHGVIFEKEIDAIKYEKYISLIKDKVEVSGYEVIEKDNAIKIIERTSIEELAELLLSKQVHKKCGTICYLDLKYGIIRVGEDTYELMETEIHICSLDKSWLFTACIVKGEYIKEYEVAMLTTLLELGYYAQAIEEFYTEGE